MCLSKQVGMADSEPPSRAHILLLYMWHLTIPLFSSYIRPPLLTITASLLNFLFFIGSLTPLYLFHFLSSPYLPCGVSIWGSDTEGQSKGGVALERLRINKAVFHKQKGAKSMLDAVRMSALCRWMNFLLLYVTFCRSSTDL